MRYPQLASLLTTVFLGVLLGGCATHPVPEADSYVEEVPGIDAKQLARETAGYLAQAYPPANTTFIVFPAHGENAYTTALAGELSKAGFALADPSSVTGISTARLHHLRYRVTAFDTRALVQLDIDERTVTQLYAAGDRGQIATATGTSIREDH